MSFSISSSRVGGLLSWSLTDKKTGTEISVLPEYGALLHGFRVRLGVEWFNVIDHYRDLAELEKELDSSFKGPKLSPFACRIADNRYRFAGKEYSFLLDKEGRKGIALHGLLYNKSFTISKEEAGDDQASLSLEYQYTGEHPAYPHVYRCGVEYILHKDNLLTVRTTISNQGTAEMPLADGWHPYFRLGGRVDDWNLQFNADTVLEFNDKLIPTGTLLPYSVFKESCPIGDLSLDNCFVLEPDWERESGGKTAACRISNPRTGLSISFFPDSSYPYLQLYIPPARESIAIENLSGAPDCFNNEMGLLRLGIGQSQTFTVNYKVTVR